MPDLSERMRHLESVETYDIGRGAPSHEAAEGWRYWDKDSDELYVNNDGANGWTLIGGGGGGGSAPHNILSSVHTDSTAASVARGDLITGQGSDPAWERLPLGDGVLMSDGVDAFWSKIEPLHEVGIVPIGGIILWSGAIATIPLNWQLCDGTSGTPNLRDRFVVGAGTTYAVDAVGGAVSQDLTHNHGPGTLETDTDAHDHDVDAGVTANDSHTHGPGTLETDDDTHDHIISGSTGVPGADYTQVTADGVSVPSTTHIHGSGTLANDMDTHDHTVDAGVTANDTHSHGPGSLETDTDTHDHNVDAGLTGNALGVTSILPPYYALAYIQRMA